MRKVVVSGCGVVSPVGIGRKTSWDNLITGKSGIGKITQFDTQEYDSRIAGEVKDFDPSSVISPKEKRRTARFVQFALVAAHEAIADSGLDLKAIDPYRVGTIIGSGIGSLETIEREHKVLLSRGPKKLSPFLIPMLITNEAAGMVAISLGLKGINFCTVTACASGANAIGEAYRIIQQGNADAIVCGGAEAATVPLGVGGFCALKALSTRNDEPERASRPFDKNRDGFIMAEGAGIVVVEELEHAKKRGAEVYCEIAGYGATCDAYHITAPDPTGAAPARAIELAFSEAGIALEGDIYINAHGTSTQLNDKMETKAIKLAFGDFAKKLHISSTKSMTGHILGAAGSLEFIFSCLAIKNKIVPPTINYETPDPECDLNYTPNNAKELDIKVASSNSFGFGGHNTTLVVKEFK